MNPLPEDPRVFYVLDPLWRAIKDIDWQTFGYYPILGISVIAAFILIFYWLRSCQESS
ncbi:MAG: hypothetical protein JRF72_06875 [Deltaproteobacteria bacterium]|nr:hypothetical protein [Deltaproteobacteria bacterium]